MANTTEFQIKADVVNGNQILRVRGTNYDGSSWTMSVGDRVTCEADVSDEDSGDAGRVSSFDDADTAIVFWDSGVETKIEVSRLSHE